MAAARQQAQERRLDRVGPEEEGRDVAVQVVDRRQRQAARPGERLRRGDADEERADKARALRDRDRVDVVERRPRFAERLAHDRDDELEMSPRRDLGHDAAIARVQLGLRGDDVRADLPCLGHERRRGLVARRLQAEDHPASACSASAVWSGTGSRHMIRASSRLSV